MKPILVRRLFQIVFFCLFVWFALVMNQGGGWLQMRGWPVNWLLELDPLVGLATVLSTGTLYRGLMWGVVTILLTLLFGRVFCGWLCPFGAMHQSVGWLGSLLIRKKELAARNRYHKWQSLKYYILIVLLGVAALSGLFGMGTLYTGFLDPIPLATRSLQLCLLPWTESYTGLSFASSPRLYFGTSVIGVMLVVLLGINLWIPRYFCRFLCPTGALLGLLARFSYFRINKNNKCTPCHLCEQHCEGACNPSHNIRFSECVVCLNCTQGTCPKKLLEYGLTTHRTTQEPSVSIERRGVLLSLGATAAVAAMPSMAKIGEETHAYNPACVRPPGSLDELEFLKRCIKCGQCMRVCPSNCIVPADLSFGIDALWTPIMHFRIGTSGCSLDCTSCGNVCPTAAIRPLTRDEKRGMNDFAKYGAIKIGTAFVDRGRCLPWANSRPCIVCQENCPVTPKAIQVETFYHHSSDYVYQVESVENGVVLLKQMLGLKFNIGTGDYWLCSADDTNLRWRIAESDDLNKIVIDGATKGLTAELNVCIMVKLDAPVINFNACIGCGVCEHECPISGLRGIRITSENETRNPQNSITPE